MYTSAILKTYFISIFVYLSYLSVTTTSIFPWHYCVCFLNYRTNIKIHHLDLVYFNRHIIHLLGIAEEKYGNMITKL
jgi:hypothetical protein